MTPMAALRRRTPLSPDQRGQVWVALGIPISLGVLGRAISELEAAIRRRRDTLAELTISIVGRRAELADLTGHVPGSTASAPMQGPHGEAFEPFVGEVFYDDEPSPGAENHRAATVPAQRSAEDPRA